MKAWNSWAAEHQGHRAAEVQDHWEAEVWGRCALETRGSGEPGAESQTGSWEPGAERPAKSLG